MAPNGDPERLLALRPPLGVLGTLALLVSRVVN